MAPKYETLPLPGMTPAESGIDLSARRAFAPVTSPQYWGVDPATFNEVRPQDEALVMPDAVKGGLYSRSAKYSLKGAGFTPFAEKVGARALRPQQPLNGTTEGEVQKDLRAAAHAFERQIPKLENLVVGYDRRREDMSWLLREIPYHWHAHTSDLDMRVRAAEARDAFGVMIDSVAASQGWSEDKLQAARLAHEKQLLTGKLDDKKFYWGSFARLAGVLALSKRAIVQNKISEMNRTIKKAAA